MTTPVQRWGLLQVHDGRLRGATGEPVLLRGVSLFWSQWASPFYTARWVRALARDWRVDVVRAALGVGPDGYLERPSEERSKIIAVIEAAIDCGLYVIVDWHSHEPETAAALLFFEDLADRYGRCVNLIFESWNEPLPRHEWSSTIKPHHDAVVAMLRARNIPNLTICGTGSHCQAVDIAAQDPIRHENVCYAVHFYAATHRNGLRQRVRAALDDGICIFASEYGLGESHGDGVLDLDEMRRWWAFLEEHGISHVNWALCDKAETCAALAPMRWLRGWPAGARLTRSGHAVRSFIRDSQSVSRLQIHRE